MRRSIAGFLIMLLFAANLSGCAASKNTGPSEETSLKETIKLYYADENNEEMVVEERQISYRKSEDKYKLAVEALLKGPEHKNYRLNISPGTQVYGTIRQQDRLIIDLSQDFNRFSGSMAEILGVGTMVNTLTQFKEINEVKILVEGEEFIGPSGQPRGFMKSFPTSATPNNP